MVRMDFRRDGLAELVSTFEQHLAQRFGKGIAGWQNHRKMADDERTRWYEWIYYGMD
jgi:hypothetical protein